MIQIYNSKKINSVASNNKTIIDLPIYNETAERLDIANWQKVDALPKLFSSVKLSPKKAVINRILNYSRTSK